MSTVYWRAIDTGVSNCYWLANQSASLRVTPNYRPRDYQMVPRPRTKLGGYAPLHVFGFLTNRGHAVALAHVEPVGRQVKYYLVLGARIRGGLHSDLDLGGAHGLVAIFGLVAILLGVRIVWARQSSRVVRLVTAAGYTAP